MPSQTEIYNFALSHLGTGKLVASTTEASQEARACNLFWETVRDATLRDFPWPFAAKIANLALVEENPNDEWDFSYAVPSDCLFLRKISSGIRNDTRATSVKFRLAYGTASEVVFTDKEDATAEYTVRVTDTGRYPADFVLAASYRLASHAAARLSGGNAAKLAENCRVAYAIELSRARGNSANEEERDEEPDSEFISVRS